MTYMILKFIRGTLYRHNTRNLGLVLVILKSSTLGVGINFEGLAVFEKFSKWQAPYAQGFGFEGGLLLH